MAGPPNDKALPRDSWQHVSDRAERRRAQNRIAQRKYRRKLKRELEELKSRVARPAATTDQGVALQTPPPSADETAPGGQHTPQCTERDTQSPQYTTQTSSPPPTPAHSDPAPPVSIDTAPTPLESFFTPCSTLTVSACSAECFGSSEVCLHGYHVCEDSSPFSAGYAAMTGCSRSVLG